MKKNLKQSKALKELVKNPILIDENIRDHSNDPFVLAKLEKAEKFIAEHGLPDSFYKKSNTKKPRKV